MGNLCSSASYSSGRIIETGCDTLSTDPPTVRFTFAVENDCESDVDLGDVRFSPPRDAGPATTHAVCSNAPGRRIGRAPRTRCMMGERTGTASILSALPPDERLDGFSLVALLHACCYGLYCIGCGPAGDVYCSGQVCFSLDRTVAARVTSWGGVKAIYR